MPSSHGRSGDGCWACHFWPYGRAGQPERNQPDSDAHRPCLKAIRTMVASHRVVGSLGGSVHLLKIRPRGRRIFGGGAEWGTANREDGLKTPRGVGSGARPHFLVSRSTFCDPHHSYFSGAPIASAQWFAIVGGYRAQSHHQFCNGFHNDGHFYGNARRPGRYCHKRRPWSFRRAAC